MPAEPRRIQELFLAAVEHADAAGRAALLDRECAADAELRQRVEALLRAHDEPGSFLPADGMEAAPTETLDLPPPSPGGTCVRPAPATADDALSSELGSRYKLLRQLGEGGMGAVWLAEQREPVKRQVAIKLIKPGMDSKQVLARLDAERQALALMDHPNIAKVLDGGTTPSGRPYFVMELVKGMPLTEYCDRAKLTIGDRLALFAEVCAAVQHAHQKGVIHRDLKPGNILVTERDGKPVPKVIDFGLAKALHGGAILTDQTVNTAFGSVVGTPLYMAPEQLAANALDVDTRADVYALGVILYELLTGTTPLERHRLRQAAWDEIRRVIREEDPPKPSTRLSSSEVLPSIAAQRDVEPAKLGRLIRGDLDWIVMKALEKDRSRRYDSASGLALDLQRYLANEPVEACPPSRSYRLRKFVRRNQAPVAAAALVLLAVVGGFAGTAWGLVRAERARRAEVVHRQDAERRRVEAEEARMREAARAEAEKLAKIEASTQRDRALEAEAKAKKEMATALALSQFLQGDLLQFTNPLGHVVGAMAADPDVRLRDLILRAANGVERRFKDQPLIEAEVRTTIGNALLSLGSPREAFPHLQRALKLRQDELGDAHADTLAAMNNLVVGFVTTGARQEALQLGKETYAKHLAKFGPDGVESLRAQFNLADVFASLENFKEALPIYEDCGKRYEAVRGSDNPSTLLVKNRLGVASLAAGHTQAAISTLESCSEKMASVLGPEHADTITCMLDLALGYLAIGENEKSVPLIEKCVEIRERRHGADHLRTVHARFLLASAYAAAGAPAQAVPLLEKSLRIRLTRLGIAHPATTSVYRELVSAHLDAGEAAKSLALAEEFVERFEKLGRKDAEWAGAQTALGRALVGAGYFDRAESLLREAHAFRAKYQPETMQMSITQAALGQALLAQKKYADAEPLLVAAFAGLRERSPQMALSFRRRRLLDVASDLVNLNEAMQRAPEAAKWRGEVASLRTALEKKERGPKVSH